MSQIYHLNSHIFHISLYDIFFLGTLFSGLTIAVFLGFAKSTSQRANRYLALALTVMVFYITRILVMDVAPEVPLPRFSLAFGPLLYFYVRKLIRPEQRFCRKDLLHFTPLLLEQALWAVNVSAMVEPTAFISVSIYLYSARNLIEHFYKGLKFKDGDRYRYQWQWLRRLPRPTTIRTRTSRKRRQSPSPTGR